ncbi:alkyl hydroperoxide reductase and/or thiol-speci fic antioxidant family (AhpC/TSA) protein [Formosa agariphila KMM 3901]|uniref:Alkyl hydroperoxide reductase and/or thiol-speci fic antioxidant family (AhpC/TSA) protein n=1 Tax=Formosa agariphila (strain DSM 15362 / KCTC 12365 / LMG 23005 / KMM 3901 / M-2Alg 35-1) TaxID=1347342 RepID=T2KL43_FORAG|nr:thioredoxin family protein [Formosa agariphila]CDF79455.1 alkyl hydroperoxide reductase and/or thiol-speci fic antioxidant family (AhpC/TSA) protein [Formosa agariphila KMM 3901]
MKKINIVLAAMVLIAGTLTSCKNKSETPEEANLTEHHSEKPDHPRPEHPPLGKGDRKGPPPGGGHDPVQSKSLEEIGGYKIGDVATDFKLKNVDGNMFSLSDIKDAKGYIVVFTCNECPFSKMYEDRLIDLHNTYAPKGYSVVAINPNYTESNPKENFEAIKTRAEEKAFPFVYLADEGQKIFPQYGAVRTPHVFLLDQDKKVQYIGTIDDNAKSAEDVKIKYVEDAIAALENGTKPNPNFTKAIGCPVKKM